MERQFLSYRKTCPFLFNNFRISVSDNRVALDFLKKFKAFCPYLYHRKLLRNKENSTNFAVQEKKKADSQLAHNNALKSDVVASQDDKAASGCPFHKFQQQYTQKKQEQINNVQKQFDKIQKYIIEKHPFEKKEMTTQLQEKPQDSYQTQFVDTINQLKDEGRYRVFTNLIRDCGNFPSATQYDENMIEMDLIHQQKGQQVTVWCSNDYMGMGQNHVVKKAMIDAITQTGVGAGGTRNIGGSSVYHVQLEKELADLHGKDQGLVFSSGFVANQGALIAIAKVFPNIIYLSDEKNHASIIEGIRNSKADQVVWKHNDLHDLEEHLKKLQYSRPQLIIFESVYSMSGTVGPIKKVCELAQKYNAMTFVDEVHAVGLYGNRGAGVAEEIGEMENLDFISGTLGKAFGCFGGYVVGSQKSMDCIRLLAPNFIFTTSLPPCVAAAAQASVSYLKNHNELRESIHSVAGSIQSTLKEMNIITLPSESHIVPVFIGDAQQAQLASDALLAEFNIYIQPINFPTVPRGQEILRISPSPNHTPEMIMHLGNSLYQVFKSLGIPTLDSINSEDQLREVKFHQTEFQSRSTSQDKVNFQILGNKSMKEDVMIGLKS